MAGVVRIGVRSWGRAGDELVIELNREAPNIIGLLLRLEDGASVVAAVVREERVQDGCSVLICQVARQAPGEEGLGA